MTLSKRVTQSKALCLQHKHNICVAKLGVPKIHIGSDLFGIYDFSLIYRLELDFVMGEWLGKGGFGHVYEVTSKTDGGSYALKIVQLPDK